MIAKENLLESIETGALIDVSHLARGIGILHPTFVTWAFWNSFEMNQSDELVAGVMGVSEQVHFNLAKGRFGGLRFFTESFPGYPWAFGASALIEQVEDLGTVVLFGEFAEELDLSIPRSPNTGSFFTM